MLLCFDADDMFLRGVAFEEEAPIGVKVNRDGVRGERLFVSTKSGIVMGDLDGDFDTVYLNWGHEKKQMDNPSAALVFNPAAVSSEASTAPPVKASEPLTIVCDVLNYRVQAFESIDSSPVLAWTYGGAVGSGLDVPSVGEGKRGFGLPVDVALSDAGQLFVLDALSSEIVVLDAATGRYVYTVSGVGSKEGLLFYPAAISYAQGTIYVADKFNDRLTVFSDAPPAPPEPVAEVTSSGLSRWWLVAPLLIALAAVLVRLLTLRTPYYVLDLSFLEQLASQAPVQRFAIENFDYLQVAVGTEAVANQTLPGFPWRIDTFDEGCVEDLMADCAGLNEQDATALAVVLSKRRRSYLLTASRLVERVAEKLDVPVLRFAEFRTLAYAVLEAERWEKSGKDSEKTS